MNDFNTTLSSKPFTQSNLTAEFVIDSRPASFTKWRSCFEPPCGDFDLDLGDILSLLESSCLLPISDNWMFFGRHGRGTTSGNMSKLALFDGVDHFGTKF